MSQFEGSKLKVRCTDCTKLSGTRCAVKDTTVSPKKRRVCGIYEFKGEYENRTPAESVYLPHIDKKTLKMLKRLAKLGILPVSEDGSLETRGGFYRDKTLPMPSTTATSSLVGVQKQEDPLIYQTSSHEIIDPKLTMPEVTSTEYEPEDDNRGG